MKSSILQPDDFNVGMFITVKDVRKQPCEFDEEMPSQIQAMIIGAGATSSKQNSLELLKGCVIRVDAISLPFIMTTVFESIVPNEQLPRTHPISLDVRDANFMKINEEYTSAYLGSGPFASLLQGENFTALQNIEGYQTLYDILETLKTQLTKEEKRRKDEN